MILLGYFFFFFKQKTAYEMRISDWSSDVCSSDLKINYKVREHSLAKVPNLLVVGKREAEEGTVALRVLGGQGQQVLSLDEAVARLAERSEEHTSELQSLMRISYAVFCLKKKKRKTDQEIENKTNAKQQHRQLDSI